MALEATDDTVTQEAAPLTPEAAPAAPAATPEAPAAAPVVPPVAPESGIKAEAKATATAEDSIKDAALSDKETPAEAKPIEYGDFVVPEGMTLSPEQLEAFKPVAQELGLSQEQAQKLIDLQSTNAAAQGVALEAELKAETAGWKETLRAEPNYSDNLQLASDGIDALDAIDSSLYADLKAQLGEWNPVAFKVLSIVGKSVQEGRLQIGGANPSRSKDTMYPEMQRHKAEQGIQ